MMKGGSLCRRGDLPSRGRGSGSAAAAVRSLTALACLCLPASPAAGIVGGPSTAPTGRWAMDWNYVYRWRGASAVAVDDYWILTVAHIADDGGDANLTIGAQVYTMEEIVFHQPSDPNDDPADLALIRFDKKLPGHYDVLTNGMALLGEPNAIMIGYGTDGVRYETYYTSTPGTEGTKRWGTNKIDIFTIEDHAIGGATFSSVSFGMWYVKDDTEYESGFGWLDSGGGTFIHDGNEWVLAGINEVVYDNGNTGQYVRSHAVSLASYADWITGTVPEPGAAVLLSLGSAALLLRRTRTARRRR